MTEAEQWALLRRTALCDHDPFCNYGRTNGREMCTCQVLVDFVEAADAQAPAVERGGRSRSDQRRERLARRKA